MIQISKGQIGCILELKGNFYFSITLRKQRPLILLSFSLSLEREDKELATTLKNLFGGELKENDKLIISIRDIESCYKVAKFFENYDFLTSKKEKILAWKRVVEIVKNKDHLKKEGFLEICKLKDEISGTKTFEKFSSMIERGELSFENFELRKKISEGKKRLEKIKEKI